MITMETMKAGGSRRKQTKPNRVPFGVDPTTGAFNATLAAADERERGPDNDPQIHHNEGRGEMMMMEESAGDGPLDMHVSIFACEMCSETFPSDADLRDHLDSVHSGSAPLKRSRMDMGDFPTAYHRLGSELYQENSSLLPNGHDDEQAQALSLTKPKMNSQGVGGPDEVRNFEDAPLSPSMSGRGGAPDPNAEGRPVKGGNIFHLDAYCELCNREFCNKYFLKTHKANKHGVYDNSAPSTPLPSDASTQPSFDANLPPPSQKIDLSPSPWQQQSKRDSGSTTNNHRGDSQTPSKKQSEVDLDTQKKVSSVITAVMNSMSNSQNSDGKTSGSGSSSSTKDPSMEDYCEFCQKHFCNKYYLKKHKQDVHGIIPETGPTTTKRSRASNSLLDLPVMSTSMGSPLMLPQPMASLGGMPALPPGVMVLNPFMHQMIIPTGGMPQPFLHASQLHHPPQSPVLSQSLPMPGSIPGISPNTPTSQGGGSQMSPNPDTFCRECRKEFSNPYFLKIHKANRHGLPSDDVPPMEAKMMAEMVESSGIPIPSPRPPSRKDPGQYVGLSSPPPLTSINQKVTCRMCDKDFPSTHTLRMHQIVDHGGKNIEPSLPDGYENCLPKSESESMRRPSTDMPSPARSLSRDSSRDPPGGNTMFGNIVAAKLADRVTCDICEKDLCNKYFLKAHKLKMHGVDVDKEEREQREREGRPPSSSGSSKSQHSPTTNSSTSNNKPLNMSMGSSPKPPLGPPNMMPMPKLEMRDFSDYGRDIGREFKMMEKFGALKGYTDVPTFLSDTINQEYMRRSHTQPPYKGLDLGLPPTSAPCGNMSHDQLLEEGIDPEAYCDICKKEFCSKYFLRTHKQNIHGIKVEVPPIDRSRAKPGPKPSLSKLSGNPLAGIPMPGMPFNLPPGFMMGGPGGPLGALGSFGGGVGGGGGGSRGSSSRDSFEKGQFRWKDPNNSQRVTCDICLKEVCNKYFLRTHKQKKHGIAPSEGGSGSPMSGSPAPSENDASSNHSSQPDNFLLDKSGMMIRPSNDSGPGVPTSIPLPPSERSSAVQKAGSDRHDHSRAMKTEEEKNFLMQGKFNNNNNSTSNNNRDGLIFEGVTCYLCDRKFRSSHWLSAHLMKDHAEALHPEFMDPRFLPPPFMPSAVAAAAAAAAAAQITHDLDPRRCHICRQLLPNELKLQLHLIHEHNAQINIMDDSPRRQHAPRAHDHMMMMTSAGSSRTVGLKAVKPWKSAVVGKQGLRALGKQKMYVCSSCGYRTHWLTKLQDHEDQTHRRTISTDLSATGVVDVAYSKQFKCGLCTSRFATHAFCQTHLREAHIHMLKDFVARKRGREQGARGPKRLQCSQCSFTTAFHFRLHSHVSRFHRRFRPRVHRPAARLYLTNGHEKGVDTSDHTDINPESSAVVTEDESSPQASPELAVEAPSFERPPSEDEEFLKPQSYHIVGRQDDEEDDEEMDDDRDREAAVVATSAAVSRADNYLGMRQRAVHEPVNVSTTFRVAEVTP